MTSAWMLGVLLQPVVDEAQEVEDVLFEVVEEDEVEVGVIALVDDEVALAPQDP